MTSLESDHNTIKRLIVSNQPFFIGRIAGIELKAVYAVLHHVSLHPTHEIRMGLENNAGIYVKDQSSLEEYVTQLLDSYQDCTLIAEWNRTGRVFAFHGMGQDLVAQRTPSIPKIDALALEPYYVEDSWMSSLQGKSILIVHPFAETMKKQVAHLSDLFPNRDWFTDCTFQFIMPPFTLAGNHQEKDWQEHYHEFLQRLSSIQSFDIALVGAGGYGMLISNYIYKEMGKSVMYIGGALQLFFGIIGKRWFDHKEIMKLVNDNWVRPGPNDKPSHFSRVEKGCYW